MKKLVRRLHHEYATPAGPRLIDLARNQFVPPNREEYVRQDVLHSLVEQYGYPLSTILSEEPVARGTRNLGRVDVLVELPNRVLQAAQFDFTEQLEAEPVHARYSEKLAAAQAILSKLPSIRLITVPDSLSIDVAGDQLECQVRGFTLRNGGHALWLVPQNESRIRHKLPRDLFVQINGYSQTKNEVQFSRKLGFEPCEWTTIKNEAFAEQVDACLPQYWEQLGDALSANGESGWVVACFGKPVPHGGVLCWLDTAALPPAPEDDDDEESLAVRQDPAESIGTDTVGQPSRWGDDALGTFAVVECKAPEVELTDEVFAQGRAYATARKARFLWLTNGHSHKLFAHDAESGTFAPDIDDLPAFNELISGQRVKVGLLPKEATAVPLVDPLPQQSLGFHARHRDGTIGIDTPEQLWRPLLALDDLLSSSTPLFTAPSSAYGLRLLEDRGLHEHEVGNLAGGRFGGAYRDLVIELPSGKTAMCGLCLFSQTKTVDHRSWGTRSGSTVLFGALSFDSELRPAINCRLDEGIQLRDGLWQFVHNGSITVGKGAISPKRLRAFLASRCADLVAGEKVLLGALPDQMPLQPRDAFDFIARFVAYVVLREEFKDQIRKDRGTKNGD